MRKVGWRKYSHAVEEEMGIVPPKRRSIAPYGPIMDRRYCKEDEKLAHRMYWLDRNNRSKVSLPDSATTYPQILSVCEVKAGKLT